MTDALFATLRTDLAASDFEPHIGEAFTLHAGGGTLALHLDAARRTDGRDDCFTLLFRAPGGEVLDQATYAVEHPVVGRMALFLVPVGRGADGMQAEAVFNRATR